VQQGNHRQSLLFASPTDSSAAKAFPPLTVMCTEARSAMVVGGKASVVSGGAVIVAV
jgi:hypothetical protein